MKYFIDTEFHEYQKQTKLFGLKVGTPTDTIDLISIGIVDEKDHTYYAICNEFDVDAAWSNEWLRENVLKQIFYEMYRQLSAYAKSYHSELYPFSVKGMKRLLKEYGKPKWQIAQEIKDFVGFSPEFYAYYADYDWVVFCWLFGRMVDLPRQFPMYCRDLKQMLDEQDAHQVNKYPDLTRLQAWLQDVKKYPDYPKQADEHNALADAVWNKELYEFIKRLNQPRMQAIA